MTVVTREDVIQRVLRICFQELGQIGLFRSRGLNGIVATFFSCLRLKGLQQLINGERHLVAVCRRLKLRDLFLKQNLQLPNQILTHHCHRDRTSGLDETSEVLFLFLLHHQTCAAEPEHKNARRLATGQFRRAEVEVPKSGVQDELSARKLFATEMLDTGILNGIGEFRNDFPFRFSCKPLIPHPHRSKRRVHDMERFVKHEASGFVEVHGLQIREADHLAVRFRTVSSTDLELNASRFEKHFAEALKGVLLVDIHGCISIKRVKPDSGDTPSP